MAIISDLYNKARDAILKGYHSSEDESEEEAKEPVKEEKPEAKVPVKKEGTAEPEEDIDLNDYSNNIGNMMNHPPFVPVTGNEDDDDEEDDEEDENENEEKIEEDDEDEEEKEENNSDFEEDDDDDRDDDDMEFKGSDAANVAEMIREFESQPRVYSPWS